MVALPVHRSTVSRQERPLFARPDASIGAGRSGPVPAQVGRPGVGAGGVVAAQEGAGWQRPRRGGGGTGGETEWRRCSRSRERVELEAEDKS